MCGEGKPCNLSGFLWLAEVKLHWLAASLCEKTGSRQRLLSGQTQLHSRGISQSTAANKHSTRGNCMGVWTKLPAAFLRGEFSSYEHHISHQSKRNCQRGRVKYISFWREKNKWGNSIRFYWSILVLLVSIIIRDSQLPAILKEKSPFLCKGYLTSNFPKIWWTYIYNFSWCQWIFKQSQ